MKPAAPDPDSDPVPRLGAGHPVLGAMVEAAARGGAPLMLLHVGIGHFISINENMGREVGDRALHLLGRRLQRQIGGHGVVWRHGSDEFVVAMPCLDGIAAPEAFAAELRRQLELPLAVAPYTLFLSVRVGLALCPAHSADASQLLHFAEVAVYRAAREGMGPVRMYGADALDAGANESVITRHIVDAIRNGELRLHYQPKVSARDGRVVGLEVLLRWESPLLGW